MDASTRHVCFVGSAQWARLARLCLATYLVATTFVQDGTAQVKTWAHADSGEYDPFEEVATTDDGEPSQCAFQDGGPTMNGPFAPSTGAPEPPIAGNDSAADDSWQPRPLADLSTNILLPNGLLPRDYWAERPPQPLPCSDAFATRCWATSSFNWQASCLAHNPLYFEQVNLERYGYGCSGCGRCCGCNDCCSTCLQSAAAAAHFFGTMPALPYLMAVDCPAECDYTLGHYRPGSCPPWRYTCCSSWSAVGGLSEAGVLTGLIFLIP